MLPCFTLLAPHHQFAQNLFMPAPKRILELIERFSFNEADYRSGNYNETQLRREFLDPFFKELGWDVDNQAGYAEAYKDVIHEYALRGSTTTKEKNVTTAPDYCFRIGGARKFFLEAKKPLVNIKEDISPAFQLRRYAWSAKLPLSVLSDFEEFAIYDCRIEPVKTDKASKARIFYCRYTEYLEKWDEIASIFSKDAILKGSFDKYASGKNRKGTQEVDDAFLAEIEQWRETLAKNLALRNPSLTTRELNFAVQRTIDRIVFLRICEDRGIERYGQLQDLLKSRHVYQELCLLFQRADDRYNSGLFHFRKEKDRHEPPDDLTLKLHLDEKPLKEILNKLYYPDSPYEFSVLPADILGQVYEQFLGKVIRLTAGHQAKVEDKPEVKKAGGVYYTPTYIVDYIVKQTVGKVCEGQTPKDVAKLRILDPACGSGSFLLGAFQYLLDWHRSWYTQHDPDLHARGKSPALRQNAVGEWQLTTSERKRILVNNIYGVDIDAQAVETTKLSLLLKVLEGETAETVAPRLIQERALPDLADNIKCGNSLIGPDFYNGQQISFFDEDEIFRINVFDWAKEFPAIMKSGGFDVVIGNPPYIRIHNLVEYQPLQASFVQTKYESAKFGKIDLYVVFIEKANMLLKASGLVGFIVPNKFLQADYGRNLRAILAAKKSLCKIVDFGSAQVFQKATTYTCLLFLRGNPSKEFLAAFNNTKESARNFLAETTFEKIDIARMGPTAWLLASGKEKEIAKKIESKAVLLPKFVEHAITGVKTGANSVFTFEMLKDRGKWVEVCPEGTDQSVLLEKSLLRPYCKAESLKRYKITPGDRLLLYPYELVDRKTKLLSEKTLRVSFPKAWQYLNSHRLLLESRQKGKLKGPSWYGLSFSSSISMFAVPKIVTPTLSPTNAFSIDTTHLLFPQGAGGGCGLVVKADLSIHYLLGLLNSKLLTFYFHKISSRFQGGWFAYEPRYLKRIPIRPINFQDKADHAHHDRMVKLVEQMLQLHCQIPLAKTAHEQTLLQRQISVTDGQIDRLVYELYGLSEDEIRIVETGEAQ